MIGQTLAARDDTLAENPSIAVGFARGWPRPPCLALANPGGRQTILKEQKIVSGTVPVAELYTGALIDEINRFDQAAIVKMAKDYKP